MGRRICAVAWATGLLFCVGAWAADREAPISIGDLVLRMRYVAETKEAAFVLRAKGTLRAGDKETSLEAGQWNARVRDATPARQRRRRPGSS